MREIKMVKLVLTSLLAFFVTMSCFSVSASASEATGSVTTQTVYGYTYSFYSMVQHTSTTETWGIGYAGTTGTTNVPTGYFGVNARLYNSTGTLLASSGMKYNSDPAASIKLTSGKTKGNGTFYGRAQVSFYNGNGYVTYSATASPNIQRSSRSLIPVIPEMTYEVNTDGLTYGSDYYTETNEDSPDLIKAIGKNGVEGYVYSKDITVELNSLNEVLDYINSGQSELNYTVPVYEKDGITVIDTFEVTGEL